MQRRSSACASPELTQRAEARGEEQERSKNVGLCYCLPTDGSSCRLLNGDFGRVAVLLAAALGEIVPVRTLTEVDALSVRIQALEGYTLKGYTLSEQNCSQIKKYAVACFEFTAFDCRNARSASGMGHSLPICFVLASYNVCSTPKADIRFQRNIRRGGPIGDIRRQWLLPR